MHSEHNVFMQAVRAKRKVIVTYFSGQYNLYLTKLCVPIHHSPADPAEGSDCYYFWDSEGDTGERMLGFPPSQIVHMDLSDETFDPAEHIIPEAD